VTEVKVITLQLYNTNSIKILCYRFYFIKCSLCMSYKPQPSCFLLGSVAPMTDSLGFQKCRPDIAKHLPLVRRFVILQLYNTNSMLQILFYQMQPVHVLQTSAKLLSAGECSANDRLPWLSEMSARHCHASAFGDRFITLQLHNTNSMLLILFYQMQPVHVL